MVHTRATNSSILPLDSEIERTLSRLRREARELLRELPFNLNSAETEAMEDRTLKQLTTQNFQQQPLAVQFPVLNEGVKFELKSGLIHLLPQFHGHGGEDPNKHLAEFDQVC